MEAPYPREALIPARSRRQAMEWSLVLLSQNIEVSIGKDPALPRFHLSVQEEDLNRALTLLHTYQLENPKRTWSSAIPVEDFEFEPAAVLWCALILATFVFQSFYAASSLERLLMENVLVKQGQWWRLSTSTWLHNDIGHLASNLSFGFLFLGIASPRYGLNMSLLIGSLAGIMGNALGCWIRIEPYQGLGASGVVMGWLGLLAMQTLPDWIRARRWRRALLSTFGAGACVFIILGLDAKSDVLAHFGGFLGGAFFGALLSWIPPQVLESKKWTLGCLALFVILTTGAWIAALR